MGGACTCAVAIPGPLHLFSTIGGSSAIALLAFSAWVTRHNYATAQEQLAAQHAEVIEISAQLNRRNEAFTRLFDHMAQGVATIDAHGAIGAERSAVFDIWFGSPAPGDTFAGLLSEHDACAAAFIELGLEQLRDDILPVELVLDQLPSRVMVEGRHLQIEYTPLRDGADGGRGASKQGTEVAGLMVVITDVTEAVRADAAERSNLELIRVLDHGTRDRNGLLAFINETDRLVQRAQDPAHDAALLRTLHTIKGTTSLFGLGGLSELVHEQEGLVAAGWRLLPESGHALSYPCRFGLYPCCLA